MVHWIVTKRAACIQHSVWNLIKKVPYKSIHRLRKVAPHLGAVNGKGIDRGRMLELLHLFGEDDP